jgi:hypothetical protein
MSEHAKLSASGSGKWLVCTPSAQLESEIPDEESDFAKEGTFAHAVFAQDLNTWLGRPVDVLPTDLLHFDSQDLRDHVADAVERAKAAIEEARAACRDPVIYVEQKLDFSPWVPKGFGTGDLVIITDDLAWVLDLKYGKGVPVSAVENSQMRLYGLGAYNELSHLYDIRRIRMHILQPRLDNWSSEELTVYELLDWAKDVVVPKAIDAWDGRGELVAGDHCSKYFCRARYTCPARNVAAKALIESSFAFLPPDMLNPQQLFQVMSRADEVIKWLTDVQTWALKYAEKGNPLPGFKLVEGRSNRRYTSQDEVASKLVSAGVDEALIYERSLLGITAMEKLLGKKKFAEILGDLIEKPVGKPTLVPESDKRPAIDALAHFKTESLEDNT